MDKEKFILAKKWFLYTALHYLGKPYIWGGYDPSGFDCSGYVVECLKTAGLIPLKSDFTAEGLRHRFCDHEISAPSSCSLLFSLNKEGRAVHVAICLDSHFQISASGGNRATTSNSIVTKQNAYIKIRPINMKNGKKLLCDPFLLKKNEPLK